MAFKKHILKISLLILLLLSGVLAINSLWAFSGNAQSTQTITGHYNTSPPASNTSFQPPSGQFQAPDASQKMAPPHGTRPNGMTSVNTKASSNYTYQIMAYSIIFLLLFLTVYYLVTKKKVKIQPSNEKILILTILGVGLFLRISLAMIINGHPFDLGTFKNWATTAANNFSQFYQGRNASDYPPLYIYVLFLIGRITSIPALSPYITLFLKLPSIVADITTSLLMYKLAKKYLSSEISFLIAAFYTFNPAVIINSTIWGQVDSFFTLMIVSAIVLLSEKKIGFATVLFTAAVLMKPQGIIFLPVLCFELIRQKNLKSWMKVFISGLVTAIVLVLPFSLNMNGLWIFKLFANTLGEYPYASVNAFNFYSLLGANFAKDAGTLFVFSYHSWGLMAIIMITAFSWFLFIKANNRVYASAVALLLIVGVFTFSTRMHERYLFPAVALSILTFIYLRDKRLMLLAAGFSTTIYINTHFVLYQTLSGINTVSYGPILIATSFLNILLFVYLTKVLYEIVKERSSTQNSANSSQQTQGQTAQRPALNPAIEAAMSIRRLQANQPTVLSSDQKDKIKPILQLLIDTSNPSQDFLQQKADAINAVFTEQQKTYLSTNTPQGKPNGNSQNGQDQPKDQPTDQSKGQNGAPDSNQNAPKGQSQDIFKQVLASLT